MTTHKICCVALGLGVVSFGCSTIHRQSTAAPQVYAVEVAKARK